MCATEAKILSGYDRLQQKCNTKAKLKLKGGTYK
jgi:hypothetical protein